MPWFVGAYILLIVAIGVYSFHDDRREGRSVAFLSIDAVVTGSWIYFVIEYFRPGLAEPVGLALPLLLLFSVAWTAADAWREMRRVIAERPASFDPGLSARANLWIDRAVEVGALLIGVLLLTPALIFAFLVVRRSW